MHHRRKYQFDSEPLFSIFTMPDYYEPGVRYVEVYAGSKKHAVALRSIVSDSKNKYSTVTRKNTNWIPVTLKQIEKIHKDSKIECKKLITKLKKVVKENVNR